jgi:hypothetical protein
MRRAATKVVATQVTPKAIMAPVIPWAREARLSDIVVSLPLCSRRGLQTTWAVPGAVVSKTGRG